ncbi:MAG TPA: ATP-binding protein [Ktedonobacterales bacterium]
MKDTSFRTTGRHARAARVGRAARHLPPPRSLSMSLATPELASAILDAVADAVVIYDADGGIAGANPAAISLLGLAQPGRQEALAVPIADRGGAITLLTLDGQPLPQEHWPPIRVLRGEMFTGAQTMDVVAYSVDGRELVLNVSGAPLVNTHGHIIGAVCVLRDITERKHLERELAERAAEMESIFATQVVGVAFVDRTGRIVRMNDAQRQLLASRHIDPDSPEAARIETWAQRTSPRDAQGQPVPRERLPFYRALQGETVTGEHAVELYQHTHDGQELVLRVSGAPARDAQGRILGVVLTTHDVTLQRRLEQQRLAIMRMVTHDLANPLTAVKMYLQLQQKRIDHDQAPGPVSPALVESMAYSVMRMERLLDDLRVATQMELGALELQQARHDLAAICREEAAAMQVVAGPERVVRVETPPQPVWAEVDRERIGQVIANLLTNALKYSLPDQPVVVSLQVADEHARVAVCDAGPGIPVQKQARLFEQFSRVAGSSAQDGRGGLGLGLGLGLYISKGIVAQHGGGMGVESHPDAGSTFWFTLPLAVPNHP